MDRTFDPLQLLLELDARHDELLRRLDELDQEVARVLKETSSFPAVAAAVHPPGHPDRPQQPQPQAEAHDHAERPGNRDPADARRELQSQQQR